MALCSEERRRFKLIQQNARVLYDALGTCCTTHAEHVANLGLEPVVEAQHSNRVMFELAFRRPPILQYPANESLVWLEVRTAADPSATGSQDSIVQASQATAAVHM